MDSQTWPPRTCASAFLSAALSQLNQTPPPARELAHSLRTRVLQGDKNPFELPAAERLDQAGVSVNDFEQIAPSLLPSGVCFRHVPFNTIAFRAFAQVLADATASSLVVGVGFDPSLLDGERESGRHLARVRPDRREEKLLLLDDCLGTEAVLEWAALERAVFAIDDGFWLIGAGDALGLPNTLPWPAPSADQAA